MVNFQRSGANENLKVKEYFSRNPDGGLLYRFEVDNPDVWSNLGRANTLEASNGKLYEVACHEATMRWETSCEGLGN